MIHQLGQVMRIFAAVAVCVALWLPAVQMRWPLVDEPRNTENRELAERPQGPFGSMAELQDGWERYIMDHFGFRPFLIRWNNRMRLRLLGTSPVPSVVLGKEQWLFYCSEALADGHTFDDFRGGMALSPRELHALQERLEANQRAFAEKDIAYLVVIVPNKNTIYSEYLPDHIRKFRPTTRLDQLIEHMNKHSQLRVLDLRDPLFKAKVRHPVYWKTDSHWNSFGAYVGYVEILRRLSDELPGMSALPLKGDGVTVKRSPTGGDLAQMLSLQDLIPEENETALSLEERGAPTPSGTLIFRHDSFGDNLYPYLRRHFKHLVNIAPFTTYKFQSIFERHPQAVLHVFAERYITQAIHDDFHHDNERR